MFSYFRIITPCGKHDNTFNLRCQFFRYIWAVSITVLLFIYRFFRQGIFICRTLSALMIGLFYLLTLSVTIFLYHFFRC